MDEEAAGVESPDPDRFTPIEFLPDPFEPVMISDWMIDPREAPPLGLAQPFTATAKTSSFDHVARSGSLVVSCRNLRRAALSA